MFHGGGARASDEEFAKGRGEPFGDASDTSFGSKVYGGGGAQQDKSETRIDRRKPAGDASDQSLGSMVDGGGASLFGRSRPLVMQATNL